MSKALKCFLEFALNYCVSTTTFDSIDLAVKCAIIGEMPNEHKLMTLHFIFSKH